MMLVIDVITDNIYCCLTDLNSFALTTINRAESPSETSVIRILVECGAHVNARDIYDQTPLHYAAMRGNDPAARDLLDCGAEPEVRTAWCNVFRRII